MTTGPIPSGNKKGRVAIAIDFANQIYNHKGHKTDGQYIYASETCTVFSYYDPFENNSYVAQSIVVSTSENNTVLLEDYAKDWILSPERSLNMFDSKDFLEQTCITHSIWRIQLNNDSLEPHKEYQKKRVEEDRKILNVFLKILAPKIKTVSRQLFKRFRGSIDEIEIFNQAYQLCQLMLVGENQKIIENLADFQTKNGRQRSRQYQRELRLHPLRTHKNSKKPDISKATQSAVKEAFNYLAHKKKNNLHTFLELFEPSIFANYVSSIINHDSDLVYKPWYKHNLVDHIFGTEGKYSPLFTLLRDHFKTKINNFKKNTAFDETMSYEDLPSFKRRWIINKGNTSLDEQELSLNLAKKILPKKQLGVYSKWLSGEYNSSDQNERQNLKKAKDKIIGAKLNIPIPKRQKGE